MYYKRKLFSSLKEHIHSKQITVLTGMRRTGKTTLVKHILAEITSENKAYFDLERIDNRELFSEKNYDSIIGSLRHRGLDFNKKAYIALDEIQLAHNIPSVLKYLHDNYDIKFIVTGSSSFYLKNLFTESLAGRKKVFELFPLDFGEFLIFKGITPRQEIFIHKHFQSAEYNRLKGLYEEFVEYGGFPDVVLAQKSGEKRDLATDIVSSYINIDIKTLADFRVQDGMYKLLKMLASRCCTRIEYAKLSRLSGLSRQTTQSYIDFLEKTYMIFRVPVLSNSPDREIVKAKKVYFCDNGIMNALENVSGAVKFENTVFSQLRHYGELTYYALKTGREIDFILDKKTALEVKESPVDTDNFALSEMARRANLKNARLIGRYAIPRFTDYIWAGDIQ